MRLFNWRNKSPYLYNGSDIILDMGTGCCYRWRYDKPYSRPLPSQEKYRTSVHIASGDDYD